MFKYLKFLSINLVILAACNTPRYAGVNNMATQPATVYFKDSTVIGQLSIGTKLFSFSNVKYIKFASGTSKDFKYYHPEDIKGFLYNGSTYFGKYLSKSQAFFTPEDKTFVKVLTQMDSKIKMYEYSGSHIVKNSKGSNTTVDDKAMYVELPNSRDDVLYDFTSNKFTPNFDDKVSALFADAPTLAQKIKSKDKQFFYAWVSDDPHRLQVWWNIINEYNAH